jgi:hypothetical protein
MKFLAKTRNPLNSGNKLSKLDTIILAASNDTCLG